MIPLGNQIQTSLRLISVSLSNVLYCTVVQTKSDSDIKFCLQLLSKFFTCPLHLT